MIKLRTTPASLSTNDVKAMMLEKGFYGAVGISEENENEFSNGLANDYQALAGGNIILDRTTGLMWQQSGSSDQMNYEAAQAYIARLNRDKFAGFADWRLPTLEEAMSLIKPAEYPAMYIAPAFDETQRWIWTADRSSEYPAEIWFAGYYGGYCDSSTSGSEIYVRTCMSSEKTGMI